LKGGFGSPLFFARFHAHLPELFGQPVCSIGLRTTWPDEVELIMKTLMLIIVALMVASVLSILVIKPFEQGGSNDDTPPKTIQQPEPK
jgi:multisubunit Na+/H+ antiporter MnhG subunit